MSCPICGTTIVQPIRASHLLHFYRCPECTGYYPENTDVPAYPEQYFAEGDRQSVLGHAIKKALQIFLWLRWKKIISTLPKPEGRILDYGCGNGKLVAFLLGRKMNIEGFDPSPGAVALAQKNGLPVFGTIPDKQYDLIMLWHSLEHTNTPLADLRELQKHLAPGGRFLVAVPNGDSFETHLTGGNWFCYDWPFHRIHFTPQSLARCFAEAGLAQVSVDFFNPEYTVSSVVQTFLNLFLPKNVFYSLISHRRQEKKEFFKMVVFVLFSVLLLIIFAPVLLWFWLFSVLTNRSAAIIAVAVSRGASVDEQP